MTDANDPTPEGEHRDPSEATGPSGAFEVPPAGGPTWHPAPPATPGSQHPGPTPPPPVSDPTWPGTTSGYPAPPAVPVGPVGPANPGADPTWPSAATGAVGTTPATTPGADPNPTWPTGWSTPAGGWQGPQTGWTPPGAGWTPPGGSWGPPGGSWSPHGGWTSPPAKPSRPMRRSRVAALGAVVAVAVLLLGTGVGYAVRGGSPSTNAATRTPGSGSSGGVTPFGGGSTSGSTSPTTPGTTSGSGSGSGGGRSSAAAGSPSNMAAIASSVSPELVDINTKLKAQSDAAAGTGMVLTSNGLVLTNNHVIDGATTITATDVGNGKTYQATVVGYDRSHDIAVIQLKNASGLKTVSIGDSSKVASGEGVVGIGNAGGVGGTPSVAGGSVTALDQSITASDAGTGTSEHLSGLIQTNCGIQPGDSGGPLVTTSNQVVGMDTAASATSGRSGAFAYQTTSTGSSSANQGYSIPINEAVTIAKKIEAGNGSSTVHIGTTAFLGVMVSPNGSSTSSSSTPSTGLHRGSTGFFGTGFFTTRTSATTRGASTSSGGGSQTQGAHVLTVVAGTPAATAGLGKGDIITTFGGTAVTSPTALTTVIEHYHPGDHVKVTWVDAGGQQHSATVTLANGPAA